MKNVTVTLEDEVARWVRIWAARHDTSVSKILGELLAERMREETGYEATMRRFLSRRPTRLKNEGESYPDRNELHERNLLR
jgi:plasmid stability protein